MFNDENNKKFWWRYDVSSVFCLILVIVLLTIGMSFAFDMANSQKAEETHPETLPTATYTAEYEESDVSNTPVATEPVFEMNDVCEHDWVFSEEKATLVRTVELEYVASQGIERVYLTRYRDIPSDKFGDVYIAYDKNLKDITIEYFDGEIEIEYFPAGVGMGIPRMEEYEFTVYVCANENCNYMQHVPTDMQRFYRFHIPEGTYLITY